MAESYIPPARRAFSQAGSIVTVLVASVLLAFLAASRGPEPQINERILTAVQAIEAEHASLQRDVLQARAGLLRNYDRLNQSVSSLKLNLEMLGSDLTASEVSNERLDLSLRYLRLSIESDVRHVEHFKSQNALLQNSLTIFGQLLAIAHRSIDQVTQQAISSSSDLGNAMMRFSLDPDEDSAANVRLLLSGLDRAGGEVPDIHVLVTHGRLTVQTLPVVDESVGEIQGSPTSSRARAFQRIYLEAYGDTQSRGAFAKLLLGAVSVGLCFFVAILVYRLRFQTERLKRRLSFEQLNQHVRKHLLWDPQVEDEDAVKGAMDLMRRFFEASSMEVRVQDRDPGSAMERFTSGHGSAGSDLVFTETVKSLRFTEIQQNDVPFVFSNLEGSGEMPFAREALTGGAAVGVAISGVAVLMTVEFDGARAKADAEEIGIYRLGIEALGGMLLQRRAERDRERLQDRLERSERLEAVGTLAGGIAHEFNNILGAILGYSEMALETLSPSSVTGHYVQQIYSAGKRAQEVINQILSLSRKTERAIIPFDVVHVVKDVLPLLAIPVDNSPEIKITVPEQRAVIMGQPVELQQVLLNLCKNAIEASGKTPKVEITVDFVHLAAHMPLSNGSLAAGRYIRISVVDNGTGIPEAVLPHIFEPFYTTRAAQGGTGLGLSGVYGNVQRLQGQIDVLKGIGSGTRFDIYFPESKRWDVSSAPLSDKRGVDIGSGESIAIVSEDENFVGLLEEQLAALGYEPLGFASVFELITVYSSAMPDAVIIDAQTSDAIGQLQHLSEVVARDGVILVTDNQMTGMQGFLKRGETVLKKPLNSAKLSSAVRHALGGNTT